eukprot:385297-Pelagomonas_calceolata.AAC.4
MLSYTGYKGKEERKKAVQVVTSPLHLQGVPSHFSARSQVLGYKKQEVMGHRLWKLGYMKQEALSKNDRLLACGARP